MISLALVSVIEQDRPIGRQAIDMALKTVDGPIKKGHVQFGHDLARCAIIYDLCHEYWTSEERTRFHQYMNKTVDAQHPIGVPRVPQRLVWIQKLGNRLGLLRLLL